MSPARLRLPFFVQLMAVSATAMTIPAVHAVSLGDHATARAFLYSALLFGGLTALVGLAVGTAPRPPSARGQLSALLAAFLVLPLMLAVPLHQAAGDITFLDAWFEMVSSFTTTGATLFDYYPRLDPSLHFWRAIVGWGGGFLAWTAAVAVLQPLNLGGFEVRSESGIGTGLARIGDASERMARFGRQLAPIYGGLTLALWLGLMVAGDPPLVAICHAMSTLSTSGISPTGGLYRAPSNWLGEVFIFAFLVFALSRQTFSPAGDRLAWRGLRTDPELRLGLALVLLVSAVIVLRHFAATFEDAAPGGGAEALRATWGAVFTVLSFLTTTGFESHYWLDATVWSGLSTPGLVLVGLALIGGGVATTAGGVKLLRVYALYRHSQRELERLVHPSSLGGAGAEARHIRRQGAYIAWVFFMLFALAVAGTMVALALIGVQFETAMVLSVAALSTTGPLAEVAAENPISFAGIPDAAKMVLAGAMVLGRLEAPALIALLNPEFWRS